MNTSKITFKLSYITNFYIYSFISYKYFATLSSAHMQMQVSIIQMFKFNFLHSWPLHLVFECQVLCPLVVEQRCRSACASQEGFHKTCRYREILGFWHILEQKQV